MSGWYAKYCFGYMWSFSADTNGEVVSWESRIFYGKALSDKAHIFCKDRKTCLAIRARVMWLTVPPNNPLWQFCLSLRLYRGTVRCPQVCAAEDHSPKETGFPVRMFEMLTTSWCFLRLTSHMTLDIILWYGE